MKKTEYEQKIRILIDSINKVYPSTGRLMWRSFLRGLFTAIGAMVGLLIVITIATFIFSQFRSIPVLQNLTILEKFFPKK